MPTGSDSYIGFALVAHLDILGFKNILKSVKNYQEMYNLGSNIESAFNRIQHNDNYLIRTFSDNIMLVCPIEEKAITDKKMFSFVHFIARVQVELFTQFGWFVRGGLSYGPHYHSAITIVSRPLTSAYILESTRVIYPFVGISRIPALPTRFTPSTPYEQSEPYNLLDLLIFKHPEHDFNCIDYLSASLLSEYMSGTTVDGLLSTIHTRLTKHKDLINNQLASSVDPKIISKYVALANYHNIFFNQFIDKMLLLARMGHGFRVDGSEFIKIFQAQRSSLLIYNLPST